MATLSSKAAQSSTSTAAPEASPTAVTEPLYLALGDSLTAGFTNATGDQKDRAYPALVAGAVANRGTSWEVVNLACSGETTASMIEGGRCFPAPDSQLVAAEKVLREHKGGVALVTVWIGANDVLRCLAEASVEQACTVSAQAAYAVSIPTILSRLRAAVGPQVPILALTYYDAFRATPANTSSNPTLARSSAAASAHLNRVIREAAAASDVEVVETSGPVEGVDGGDLCVRTLVCERRDIHLSPEGQVTIGAEVLRHLEVSGVVGTSPNAQ